MNRYSFNHWSRQNLLDRVYTVVPSDCATTAELLALLAEVEVRKIHLEMGYPSMFAFCVGELHFSEQTALKRIRVARVARHFPVIFEAIADGRLNLTSVILLSRHLTHETVDDLVAAATHRTSAKIEQLLAERYPRPWEVTELSGRLSARRAAGPERARVTPIAPELYRLEMALSQGAHDKLRYLQELLSHQIPSGDLEQVMEHALDLAIRQVEKKKFAAADRPRPGQASPSAESRHIPVDVQRAVWKRDGGECRFVSAEGRRCGSRWQVEFDHVHPVAQGARPPRTTFDCSAAATTSSRPSLRSGRSSCRGSDSRRPKDASRPLHPSRRWRIRKPKQRPGTAGTSNPACAISASGPTRRARRRRLPLGYRRHRFRGECGRRFPTCVREKR